MRDAHRTPNQQRQIITLQSVQLLPLPLILLLVRLIATTTSTTVRRHHEEPVNWSVEERPQRRRHTATITSSQYIDFAGVIIKYRRSNGRYNATVIMHGCRLLLGTRAGHDQPGCQQRQPPPLISRIFDPCGTPHYATDHRGEKKC